MTMRIALDYDDTYTKDPDAWDGVIDALTMAGHEVMIVTFRDESIPIEKVPCIPVFSGDEYDSTTWVPLHVFYTGYRAKRNYMRDQGIEIDVWIDDSPDTIVTDSNWTPEERERWKAQHEENLSNRVSP